METSWRFRVGGLLGLPAPVALFLSAGFAQEAPRKILKSDGMNAVTTKVSPDYSGYRQTIENQRSGGVGSDTPEAAARLHSLEQQASQVAQAHEELRQAMASQQIDTGMVIFAQKVQPLLEEIGRQADPTCCICHREPAKRSCASLPYPS